MDRQSTFQVNKVNTPNVLCGACTFSNASNPLRMNISNVNEAIGIRDVNIPQWGNSDSIEYAGSRTGRDVLFSPPQETSHISSYIPPINLRPLQGAQSRRVVHDEYCTAKEYQSLREDYFQLRLNYESLTDGLRDRGVIGK